MEPKLEQTKLQSAAPKDTDFNTSLELLSHLIIPKIL